MNDEDQRLVESLRLKYTTRSDVGKQADQGGGGAPSSDSTAAASTDAPAAPALTSVRNCTLCEGSGRRQETYNYRVLDVSCCLLSPTKHHACSHARAHSFTHMHQQSTMPRKHHLNTPTTPLTHTQPKRQRICEHCHGEGVVLPPGQQHSAPIRTSTAAASTQEHPMVRDMEQLQLELQRIEARQKGYRQELAAAQAQVEAGDGVERQVLARQLADTLEAQLGRLEGWRQARLRALRVAGVGAAGDEESLDDSI